MEKGLLIVVEGACDGIGKTTQFNLLKDYLISNGHEVVSHHFPSYGTYHGKAVENYLSGEFGSPSELSPYFVNGLYAMDRAVVWNSYLKKEYEEGKIILLDRYTTSSIIYQSSVIDDLDERKKFIDYVNDYEYNKIGIKKPDIVIFLHAPFDLVTKMRNERNKAMDSKLDIHEKDLSFMKKVYDNAMFISNYLSWDKIDCSKDEDEMKSIDEISECIKKLVKKQKQF